MHHERLVLGDTLNFTTSVADYLPADGWTLKFRLVPRGTVGSAIDLTSEQDAADPTMYRTQATAVTTSLWVAGPYSWFSYVDRDGEQYSVASGAITLVANPRTASNQLDLRSTARIALDNVQEVIRGKASSGTLSYRIGERQLQSYSMAELLRLESRLLLEVSREENATRIAEGAKTRRQVYVRLANG